MKSKNDDLPPKPNDGKDTEKDRERDRAHECERVNGEHEKDKEKSREPKSHGRGLFNRWVLTVILLALVLSVSITVITEVIYNSIVNLAIKLIVAIVLVLLILAVAIIADMIGVATTSCSVEPFMSMASRKVRGAKRAVALCKNADKVSSIFADIIGDVCGIISGSSGSTIAFILLEQYTGNSIWADILYSAIISALIAAVTIGGKAVCKRVAVERSEDVVFALAKILSVFDKK